MCFVNLISLTPTNFTLQLPLPTAAHCCPLLPTFLPLTTHAPALPSGLPLPCSLLRSLPHHLLQASSMPLSSPALNLSSCLRPHRSNIVTTIEVSSLGPLLPQSFLQPSVWPDEQRRTIALLPSKTDAPSSLQLFPAVLLSNVDTGPRRIQRFR